MREAVLISCVISCVIKAAPEQQISPLYIDSITSLFSENQFQLRIPSCVKKALAEAFTAHSIESLMELLARRYNPPEIQIFYRNLLSVSV